MEDVTICIPTRGRIGNQLTYSEFEKHSTQAKVRTVLVCPGDETHEESFIQCPVLGIGATRQWILENMRTRFVIMADDDMYFYRREAWFDFEVAPDLRKVKRPELDLLISRMIKWMQEGYIHGGLSARQGNNHVEKSSVENTRVNNFHFFDREAFLKTGIRFDALPLMEDFYVTLSLLKLGFPNIVDYKFCWNQRGSNEKGGCSLYRTPELQRASALKLAEIFPDEVTVIEKTANWKGMEARTDVRIQWKKAFKSRN